MKTYSLRIIILLLVIAAAYGLSAGGAQALSEMKFFTRYWSSPVRTDANTFANDAIDQLVKKALGNPDMKTHFDEI